MLGFFENKVAPTPEIEYISAGDHVAVACSDFPGLVVQGFVVKWSDNPLIEWALIHIWYFDEWAGEWRQLFTWEPIANMRRLDCYLAEGRQLDTAIVYVEAEAATEAAAS